MSLFCEFFLCCGFALLPLPVCCFEFVLRYCCVSLSFCVEFVRWLLRVRFVNLRFALAWRICFVRFVRVCLVCLLRELVVSICFVILFCEFVS